MPCLASDAGRFSLDNLGGVWIADRTIADPDWIWVPTPENVKLLPNMTEIQALPEAVSVGSASRRGGPENGSRVAPQWPREWVQTHAAVVGSQCNTVCAGAVGVEAWVASQPAVPPLHRLPATPLRQAPRAPTPGPLSPVPTAWQERAQWDWAVYPGNWATNLKAQEVTFNCLYNNREWAEAWAECPEAWMGWDGLRLARITRGWEPRVAVWVWQSWQAQLPATAGCLG